MCALRWTDLDLQRKTISITRNTDGDEVKSTKTHQGRRLALDDAGVEMLRAAKETRAGVCASLLVDFVEDSYVFSPAPDGSTPAKPRNMSQRYRRLAERLRLRSKRLHSLRHYSATELISAGVDIRTVAGR